MGLRFLHEPNSPSLLAYSNVLGNSEVQTMAVPPISFLVRVNCSVKVQTNTNHGTVKRQNHDRQYMPICPENKGNFGLSLIHI